MSYNSVILVGNLTRDPELRQTQGGITVGKFTLAVNEKIKDKELTSFVDCTAFGKTAEVIGKYVCKGESLLVEGKLKQETWQDKDGNKKSKLGVVANRVEFIGAYKQQSGRQINVPTKVNKEPDDVSEDNVPF